MLRDPNKIGIGARWQDEVFGVLPNGEVIASDGEKDYQGYEWVIAKLDDGRWLHYEWSYGSCSGCDAWEDNEQTIAADVAAELSTMEPEAFQDYLIACMSNAAEWCRKLDMPVLSEKIAKSILDKELQRKESN